MPILPPRRIKLFEPQGLHLWEQWFSVFATTLNKAYIIIYPRLYSFVTAHCFFMLSIFKELLLRCGVEPLFLHLGRGATVTLNSIPSFALRHTSHGFILTTQIILLLTRTLESGAQLCIGATIYDGHHYPKSLQPRSVGATSVSKRLL
jgi:hypothetical protein